MYVVCAGRMPPSLKAAAMAISAAQAGEAVKVRLSCPECAKAPASAPASQPWFPQVGAAAEVALAHFNSNARIAMDAGARWAGTRWFRALAPQLAVRRAALRIG